MSEETNLNERRPANVYYQYPLDEDAFQKLLKNNCVVFSHLAFGICHMCHPSRAGKAAFENGNDTEASNSGAVTWIVDLPPHIWRLLMVKNVPDTLVALILPSPRKRIFDQHAHWVTKFFSMKIFGDFLVEYPFKGLIIEKSFRNIVSELRVFDITVCSPISPNFQTYSKAIAASQNLDEANFFDTCEYKENMRTNETQPAQSQDKIFLFSVLAKRVDFNRLEKIEFSIDLLIDFLKSLDGEAHASPKTFFCGFTTVKRLSVVIPHSKKQLKENIENSESTDMIVLSAYFPNAETLNLKYYSDYNVDFSGFKKLRKICLEICFLGCPQSYSAIGDIYGAQVHELDLSYRQDQWNDSFMLWIMYTDPIINLLKKFTGVERMKVELKRLEVEHILDVANALCYNRKNRLFKDTKYADCAKRIPNEIAIDVSKKISDKSEVLPMIPSAHGSLRYLEIIPTTCFSTADALTIVLHGPKMDYFFDMVFVEMNDAHGISKRVGAEADMFIYFFVTDYQLEIIRNLAKHDPDFSALHFFDFLLANKRVGMKYFEKDRDQFQIE